MVGCNLCSYRNSARFSPTNDLDAAAKWLDAIVVDAQAPQTIRQRAEQLLGLVTAGK